MLQPRTRGLGVRVVSATLALHFCCWVQPLRTRSSEPSPPASDAFPDHFRALPGHLYSGSQPTRDEHYVALAALGVTTIVSVDGKTPNVAAAKRHGLRYVHIPFGYDGVDATTCGSLTQLIRQVTGPIYIHCHHGKHRGPAAAAIACIAAGNMTSSEAIDFLHRAGTNPLYTGLFRDVRAFRPVAEDASLPELVEVADLEGRVKAMSDIEAAFETLSSMSREGWQRSSHRLVAQAEPLALLMEEGFRESQRPLLSASDADLRQRFEESEIIATELRQSLKKRQWEAADQSLRRLAAACSECHERHRN